MKLTLVLLVATLVGVALAHAPFPLDSAVNRNNRAPNRVVCYWGTWSYYREGRGKFQAEDINPYLCTHVNYGFAKLEGNRVALFDPDLDAGSEDWNSGLPWGRGMIRRLQKVRTYNPNLKTLIAVGGWNEGSDKYSLMASTAAGRAEFVQSAIAFIQEHKFDGMDLDWEYPAMQAVGDADREPTGPEVDKQNFVELIKALKVAFAPYGYLLSAAVSAGAPTIARAYDVPQVSQYLDIINLMTYDFHGGWDNVTGHNSPLYPLPGATGIDEQFTVEYAVNTWLNAGVDPSKLTLGLPLYGRSFTLAGAANGIGAPAIGSGGDAGPLTKTVGMLAYNEVCSLIQNGWQTGWVADQQVPYAFYNRQWVGYDNVQSLTQKLAFIQAKGLGGGMIWSIDTDDFTGFCGAGKYPLLKTISRALIGVDGPDIIIPVGTLTTDDDASAPAHPVPEKVPDHKHEPTPNMRSCSRKATTKFVCPGVGLFKDNHNSQKKGATKNQKNVVAKNNNKKAAKSYLCVRNGKHLKAIPV